ncbi:MAG: hypothetical protein FJ303_06210 [Planctomycetes bacterium]|nr:hypothetical protein [Planctomycetota bacterium]
MNWQHFLTFLWLRWRLFANQLTRGGIVGQIILGIGVVSVGLLTITLIVTSCLLGYFILPEQQPIVILLVWDGIVLGFLMSWIIGLVAELQRAEALSLEKFLHLPVSLSSVFVLNYLSSLFCLTIVLFVPAMIGMSIGLVFGKSWMLALQVPLALSFVFMITALSYQFQGWVASLKMDERRRRTIIVVVTIVFILIFQLPNLINIYQPWRIDDEHKSDVTKQLAELKRAETDKEITPEEYKKRVSDLLHAEKDRNESWMRWAQDTAWLANMVLPIGWLPWGSAAAMEGNPWPGLGALALFTLVGVGSLWRSYCTTLLMYTGGYSAGGAALPTPTEPATPAEKTEPADLIPYFLERTIPGVSEQAAVIGLAGLRSLLRAPEVKMVLLSPIIMLVLFGGLLFRGGTDIPQPLRPLIIYGAMAMTLFTLGQIGGNQFGFDRAAFRIFVLSPAPRQDILLGKNLALAPIVFGLTLPVVAIVTILVPPRIDHLLALPMQAMSMYLIWCIVQNFLSIVAPMPVATGSLKPLSPRYLPMLMHLAATLTMPIALSPTLLPWGVEAGLVWLGWTGGFPIALLLTALVCGAVIVLYRIMLAWEGDLLQRNEQAILEAVVAKAE